MKPIKILYLYAEVMGYTLATLNDLNKYSKTELHVFHWDKKKLTPFQLSINNTIHFYNRSEYSTSKICNFAFELNPHLVVVSGWQDKGYLKVVKLLRSKNIPIVIGFDDQWHGTIRQYIASLFSPILKQYFSYAWVSGTYQYEYARRLGFNKSEIIYYLYSADLALYNKAFEEFRPKKKKKYPHRFLFVGRFEKIKGIDLLVKAWNKIDEKKGWELHCIGNGTMKEFLNNQSTIVVKDFMQPEQLKNEILDAGCFILPSRSEPWGVVLHEFAAAGLPLLCSEVCGAAPSFLIQGLNGFCFKSENICSLKDKMLEIIHTDDQHLFQMAEYSHKLGQHITPELSAASLYSVLHL